MKKLRDPTNQHISMYSKSASLFTQKYKHMDIILDH